MDKYTNTTVHNSFCAWHRRPLSLSPILKKCTSSGFSICFFFLSFTFSNGYNPINNYSQAWKQREENKKHHGKNWKGKQRGCSALAISILYSNAPYMLKTWLIFLLPVPSGSWLFSMHEYAANHFRAPHMSNQVKMTLMPSTAFDIIWKNRVPKFLKPPKL